MAASRVSSPLPLLLLLALLAGAIWAAPAARAQPDEGDVITDDFRQCVTISFDDLADQIVTEGGVTTYPRVTDQFAEFGVRFYAKVR